MSKGTYIIIARLLRNAIITIRGNDVPLRKGYYIYIGSAFGPGGFTARLNRHLRAEKKMHWHIDYLLAAARVHKIYTIAAHRDLEHALAGAFARSAAYSIPLPRFGSSDCGCPAHVFYSSRKPSGAECALLLRQCTDELSLQLFYSLKKQ